MSDIGNAAVLNKKKLKDGMIKSRKTRAGDLVIAGICFILMLVCILPMLHVLASSLSSADALVRNEVFIWPKGWNVEAYRTVLTTEKYVHSMGWTAILTVICTLLSITLTIMCAYPLTYTNLRGGKFINFIILFTMYFSAGTIPYYLLLSQMKMLNTPYALIFPNCIGVFNVIIMRSFFFGVPDSLKEAAEIDGAGPIRILIKVYLPLSLPVIATLSLFYAVGRWNAYADNKYYITKEGLKMIQYKLYQLVSSATEAQTATLSEAIEVTSTPEVLQAACIMFTTLPIICIYPFLQKYFVKGVMVGAVKG